MICRQPLSISNLIPFSRKPVIPVRLVKKSNESCVPRSNFVKKKNTRSFYTFSRSLSINWIYPGHNLCLNNSSDWVLKSTGALIKEVLCIQIRIFGRNIYPRCDLTLYPSWFVFFIFQETVWLVKKKQRILYPGHFILYTGHFLSPGDW